MRTLLSRTSPMVLLLVLASGRPAGAENLDYGLSEAMFKEPVTFSATGQPQRLSEVPLDMEIITADDIRRSGATNIPDILASYAGVNIRRNSMNSVDVAVRGYNPGLGSRMLVLINGRQAYIDVYGWVDWSSLPVQLNEIRQIELVRGPNSALFGFNAAGAVVNIVTFNPLYDSVNVAETRLGTQNYREAGVVATARTGNDFGARLSASETMSHDFKDPAAFDPLGHSGQRNFSYDETQLPQHPFNGKIAFDARGVIAPDVTVGLEATYSNGRELVKSPLPYYGTITPRTSSIKGDIEAETKVGLVSLDVYSNSFTNIAVLPRNVIPGNPTLNSDQRVTVVQLRDLTQLDKENTLRLSAEYRHNEVNTTPVADGNIFYDVFSLGAMWDHALCRDLSWNNAVRMDYLKLGRTGPLLAGLPLTNADFDKSLDTLTWNSGLVWKITAEDTAIATVARGMHLPSLYDFGGVYIKFPLSPTNTYVQSGLPWVKPAVVDNYEVSLAHEFRDWNSEVKGALFYQQNRDVLGAAPPLTYAAQTPTTTLDTLFINNGNSREIGVELSAKGKLGTAWHWSGNYSWANVSYDARYLGMPVAGRTGLPSDPANGTPKNSANFAIGYADGPWEADLRLHFSSSYLDTRATAVGVGYLTEIIPAHADPGGRLAFSPDNWLTLSVSGEQLTAGRETTTYGLRTERRGYVTATARF